MSFPNVNISLDTEKLPAWVILAVVLLTFGAEVLDHWTPTQPTIAAEPPLTLDECIHTCHGVPAAYTNEGCTCQVVVFPPLPGDPHE